MHEESSITRIEKALGLASPGDALMAVARSLKSEGVSQADMYRLFESLLARYSDPSSLAKRDSILETMDVISGWCRPELRLFDSELQR
jgi:hypothetical protein